MRSCKNLVMGFAVVLVCLYWSVPAYSCNHKRFDVNSYGKDNAAIARLVADVNKNKGGRIEFPKNETYVLSIKDDPNGGHTLLPQDASVLFLFRGCRFLDINLNGSTIVIERNHSSKYAVFLFDNCKSFALKNGTVAGDARSHDYSVVVFKGRSEVSSHEWGHGVMVMGSKGLVSNLIVKNMIGDGIYVSSRKVLGKASGAKVTINQCEISFCRRNGITCASNTGFKLKDTDVHHIGSFDRVKGTAPMAGVDFEYEDQLWMKGDVAITGCTFYECEQKAITASNSFPPAVSSFIVDDCSFQGGSFQIVNLKADKRKTVRNCVFDESPINSGNATYERCFFNMGSNLYYVHGTTFNACEFEGALDNLSGPYGCAFVGHTTETAIFEDCKFRNIRGLNDSSQAYQGFSGFNFPLVAIFADCLFENTSFVKGNQRYSSSFQFNRCTLTKGCMIYNEGGPAIVLVKSKVDNVASYQTQTGEFVFEECEIIQDDEKVENPLLYFGTHSIRDCQVKNTLSITPKMRSHGVRSIKYRE